MEPEIEVLYLLYMEHQYRPVPYEASQHLQSARKFLFWPGSVTKGSRPLLVVGEEAFHRDLYRKLKASSNDERFPFTEEQIVGAGDLRQGVFIDWGSRGYKLMTPMELCPRILRALGAIE